MKRPLSPVIRGTSLRCLIQSEIGHEGCETLSISSKPPLHTAPSRISVRISIRSGADRTSALTRSSSLSHGRKARWLTRHRASRSMSSKSWMSIQTIVGQGSGWPPGPRRVTLRRVGTMIPDISR